MKYFISAPFGNYLKLPNAISVTGSWTVEKREGLIPQIFKTLRYKNGGWINKIGLRNAGIYEGLKRTNSTDVLSLAAIDEYDWINLDRIVGKNLSVEINISCPNLDKDVGAVDLRGFDLFPKNNREWCICKIPPTATECLIDKIVDLGYNQIHASNTLYSLNGGQSGTILKPYTTRIIEYIKRKHPSVTIIAGGGVTNKDDAEFYFDKGADYVSLGTVCFTPWKIKSIIS
jgi:dihydroorotate dehydrogenase|tara:strand:+ start:776 stop:1465 length:690 start_codon:yes stop_codon:yes gene_type:complete